jgi:outer membrane autotransporter protein
MQAGIGNHHYDTKRGITFGDPNDPASYINRTAKGNYDAFLTTAHVEAGLKYRGGTLNLSPFVGGQYTGLTRGAFTETGAGSLNLAADKEHFSSFRAMFGMRFDSKTFRFRQGLTSFYGNVAWMYEFEQSGTRHTEFTARFVNTGFVKEPSFTVHGNDPGRDWVQTGFGMNYDVNSFFRTFIGYDAYANTNQVMHSANIGFVYQR